MKQSNQSRGESLSIGLGGLDMNFMFGTVALNSKAMAKAMASQSARLFI